MAEPSPILRALRPRTQKRSTQKQETDTEASEEEADGTSQVTSKVPLEEQKDNDVYNDDNNDDDDDDDEPRLTIKEEPDEDDAMDDKMSSGNKYQCKSCRPTAEFPSLVEYLKHLKDIHHQKAKCHECPHCNFICQHQKKLQRHILAAHKSNDDNTSETGKRNQCSMCTFVSSNQSDMNNHQRLHHLKRRFFRCTKCSYMTHVRARYTKHVKYHSMPMIKCDDCDFRTPYKWNLDRHTRNHGGGGAFQCRACNFTADIRQSLTVHETNHHEPPVGHSVKKPGSLDRKPRHGPKRYNQVGASDFRDLPDDSNTLKTVEVDVVTENTDDASSSIAGAECIALKCEEKGCQFITAWDSEMQRHLMECHAPPQSPNKSRKPIPMLIPLSPDSNSNSAVSNSSSPLLKVPRVRVRPELAKIARDSEIAKLYNTRESTEVKKEVENVKSFEKRNASFFDKLKERLITNSNASSSQVAVSTMDDLKCWCTFEASNSEELARHKKTHHTALSVSSHELSRCPKCRKSFQSSTDVQAHMQMCYAANNNVIISTSSQENTGINANYTTASHYADFEFPFQVDWDANGGLNSSGSSIDGTSSNTVTTRRVFKCPHCSFWASTASRFHVHIVGHLNRKPFECSLCAYRSNWRWDITKHIKLKAARDPAHSTARVLMTDETGRRNYSKYNKYLAQMEQNADDPNHDECGTLQSRTDEPPRKRIFLRNIPSRDLQLTSRASRSQQSPGFGRVQGSAILSRPPPPLQAARSGQSLLKSNPASNQSNLAVSMYPSTKSSQSTSNSSSTEETKRTLWKCKRCNFRDASKDMVLLHVKSHYESSDQYSSDEKSPLACKVCPFIGDDATSLAMHQVHHRPNLEAIFKCYLCPYYVSTKAGLLDHARLHGEELAVVHQRSTDPSPKKSKPSQNVANNSPTKMDVSVEEVSRVAPILPATSRNNDGSTPPLLLDTRALPDTPLVWVSRPDGTFVKMLKCRHCPHVSSRRAEVRDHELMHCAPNGSLLSCPDCSFSAVRKEVMDTHAEMHRGALGTVHCLVDDGRSDAQQLDDLTTLLGLTRTPALGVEPDLRDPRLLHYCNKCPARFLCEKELRIHLRYHSTELSYSCEWCSYAAKQPAHLLAHQKAHSAEYQDRSRQLLFLYSHSQRYPPPRTACIETDSQINGSSKNIAWIVVEIPSVSQNGQGNEHRSGNQVFTCAKCPARYFKLDALEYHMTLHGSNNRFRCFECDYSSKTAQNLMKHQVVHRRQHEMNESLNSRLQTSDPDYDYQVALKNGKYREKRFNCHKCPSSFDKREQYQVHLTLHGAKQRYRCDTCDFSVKYYANYVQHLKKHQEYAEEMSQLEESAIYDQNQDNQRKSAKSRRKSTISSGISGNSSLMQTFANISNQDKQSILLMQRKEDLITAFEENETVFRCHVCPFFSIDKETLDTHKRRHGLERLTPPCPHCNYVPRKDENVGEHIKLHFTRLYKPESYLVVDLLSLTMRRVNGSKKDDKKDELLFRDCDDGKFFPVINSHVFPVNVTNGDDLEKVIVDPNTGETTHRFSV